MSPCFCISCGLLLLSMPFLWVGVCEDPSLWETIVLVLLSFHLLSEISVDEIAEVLRG
jgi:hypothetical protein